MEPMNETDTPAESPTDARTRRQAAALLAPLKDAAPTLAPDREAALFRQFDAAVARPAPTPWWPALGGLTLVGAAGLAFALHTPAPTAPADVPAPLAQGSSVAVSSAPQVLAAGATVLPSGAHVDVVGAAQVAEATSTNVRLRVNAGSVKSQVPKLGPGAHYLVETDQAVVSVHGTRFTVANLGADRTRVDVEEGLVSVDPVGWRPEFFLHPGEGREVGPCAATPAEAATGTFDWRCTVDGLTALSVAAPDSLSRENLRVQAGHLLDTHAPREAAAIWRQLLADVPTGLHAEEAAFRLAESLHAAGDAPAAHDAAVSFRARFPQSPRAESTKQF